MWPVIRGCLGEAWHTMTRLRADAAARRAVAVVGGQEVHCLPEGYVARARPTLDDHMMVASSGIVWQPDVHELVFILARLAGCKTIVDLGCGFAEKLAKGHPEFEIVGIDIASNVSRCRRDFQFGTWLPADFEDGISDLGPVSLASAAVVCCDVIEHIVNVEKFVADLSKIVKAVKVTVISTPERTLTRGRFHMGPPPNPCHVREWNRVELKQFLRMHEIEGWFGLTRSEDETGKMQTIVVVATGVA